MRDDATVYSSVTLTNVMGDNISNGTGQALVSEVRGLSKGKGGANWCYLFIHHTKVNAVNEKLKERYCTFIHKSVVYKRKNKRIAKDEKPTISGLVFVQGESDDIQSFLCENFFGLYLVKDCSTTQ